MKFEEVLPKIRDEGRIANLHGLSHKFSDGKVWIKYPGGEWLRARFTAEAFTTDDWKLEPVKVVKWRWVFGCDDECLKGICNKMTEEQAEKYRVANEFDWMERIKHTRTEVDE